MRPCLNLLASTLPHGLRTCSLAATPPPPRRDAGAAVEPRRLRGSERGAVLHPPATAAAAPCENVGI